MLRPNIQPLPMPSSLDGGQAISYEPSHTSALEPNVPQPSMFYPQAEDDPFFGWDKYDTEDDCQARMDSGGQSQLTQPAPSTAQDHNELDAADYSIDIALEDIIMFEPLNSANPPAIYLGDSNTGPSSSAIGPSVNNMEPAPTSSAEPALNNNLVASPLASSDIGPSVDSTNPAPTESAEPALNTNRPASPPASSAYPRLSPPLEDDFHFPGDRSPVNDQVPNSGEANPNPNPALIIPEPNAKGRIPCIEPKCTNRKGFMCERNYRTHMRKAHDGPDDRPVVVKKGRFGSRGHLVPEAVFIDEYHTSGGQFRTCPVEDCKHKSSSPNSFNRHYITKHIDGGDGCPLCDWKVGDNVKSFSRADSVQKQVFLSQPFPSPFLSKLQILTCAFFRHIGRCHGEVDKNNPIITQTLEKMRRGDGKKCAWDHSSEPAGANKDGKDEYGRFPPDIAATRKRRRVTGNPKSKSKKTKISTDKANNTQDREDGDNDQPSDPPVEAAGSNPARKKVNARRKKPSPKIRKRNRVSDDESDDELPPSKRTKASHKTTSDENGRIGQAVVNTSPLDETNLPMSSNPNIDFTHQPAEFLGHFGDSNANSTFQSPGSLGDFPDNNTDFTFQSPGSLGDFADSHTSHTQSSASTLIGLADDDLAGDDGLSQYEHNPVYESTLLLDEMEIAREQHIAVAPRDNGLMNIIYGPDSIYLATLRLPHASFTNPNPFAPSHQVPIDENNWHHGIAYQRGFLTQPVIAESPRPVYQHDPISSQHSTAPHQITTSQPHRTSSSAASSRRVTRSTTNAPGVRDKLTKPSPN